MKKDNILILRNKGMTYMEIAKELDCAVSTVAYYCNDTTKKRCKIKNSQRDYRRLETAVTNFTLKNLSEEQRRERLYNLPFTATDVLNKFGRYPKCYLTGETIDLKEGKFHLDHFIPVAKGGDNSIENLRICTKEANLAKRDMLYEDFINLCKTVAENM
jgi:5-methylcytosine-specific restriction endonuclease McrA